MTYGFSAHVLVFTSGDQVSADLADQSAKRRWPVICLRDPGEALRQVQMSRPSLVLLEVSNRYLLDEVLVVIELLRRRCPWVAVITCSPEHDARIEQAVRCAGVTAYAGGGGGFEAAARMVVAVRPQDGPVWAHAPLLETRARPPNRALARPP